VESTNLVQVLGSLGDDCIGWMSIYGSRNRKLYTIKFEVFGFVTFNCPHSVVPQLDYDS